jgi:hypothetical protein
MPGRNAASSTPPESSGYRRTDHRRRAVHRRALAVAGALAMVVAWLSAAGAGAADDCKKWSGRPSLQVAVNANTCTEVQRGSYQLAAPLIVPDGHRLIGDPDRARAEIVLRPSPSWASNGYEAVIMGMPPPHTAPAQVSHLVVDAGGVATGGLGGANMTIDDTVVRNGRCWGIAVVGYGMHVTGNLIERNGADPTCPSPPGAGIYVAANGVPVADYGPVIAGNAIRDNVGPGVDIDDVWWGRLVDNLVTRNSGWAGVSLVGSHWTISGNAIDQPSSDQGQPWVPPCASGPAGAHSAAIVLCQATIAAGAATAANTLTGNTVRGWYGILLIGNDEANRLAVPWGNLITQTTFRPATVLRCADDRAPGDANDNVWAGCVPTRF